MMNTMLIIPAAARWHAATGPTPLTHKQERRNNEGEFHTAEIADTAGAPPRAALAFPNNCANGTWLSHPNGAHGIKPCPLGFVRRPL
jgi:hypothetical protein